MHTSRSAVLPLPLSRAALPFRLTLSGTCCAGPLCRGDEGHACCQIQDSPNGDVALYAEGWHDNRNDMGWGVHETT